jgi:hypothetical protein
LRNSGLDYVQNCRVLLAHWDQYLTPHNDFTRNTFEPFPVLSVKHLDGGQTSSSYAFGTIATTPVAVLRLSASNFDNGRRTKYPEIIEAGTWKAEFAIHADGQPVRTESHFLQWQPGGQPEVVRDPRVASGPFSALVQAHVRVTPVIPIAHGQAVWVVRRLVGEVLELEKTGTFITQIMVPLSRITIIPSGPGSPLTFDLAGRLQWVTLDRTWRYIGERPPAQDEYGFGRSADDTDELILQLQQRGDKVRFASQDRIAHYRSQGYEIVYDDLGFYLRRGEQLLMATL